MKTAPTTVMLSEAKHLAAPQGRHVLHAAQLRLTANGIDDSVLEAELLLAHALGISRTRLYAMFDAPVSAAQRGSFEALVARRLAHEPLAYITGHREFYGIDLLCSPVALIPRPETELLVELALDRLRHTPRRADPPTVVDVGTGGGAIAIALAANAPEPRIVAIDTQAEALALAAENARRIGVDRRIDFVHGPLLAPVRRADVIVANLPYISDGVYSSLAPELHHEPEMALRAGPRGTELIEALLTQARDVLAPGGLLVAEHAWDQGESLRNAARAIFPRARTETKRDLAGLERALVVRAAAFSYPA